MQLLTRIWLPLYSTIIVGITIGLCGVSTADAEDWTRFRGSNGSGISDAKGIPSTWSKDDHKWTAHLPGEGCSSPVVWGERLFVTSADADAKMRYLQCLNTKTGAENWRLEFPFESYKKHKNNSFASSTPAVDADHVYVTWFSKTGSPIVAVTHAGEIAWQRDLGPYLHGQGGAASPIVYEGKLIVPFDHSQGSYLAAFSCKTGEPVWQIPREGK